jgi:hypothetical protein
LTELAEALSYLRSPEAVRARSENIFRAGLDDQLEHFSLRLERLPDVVRKVVDLTLEAYPDGKVPIHGRLRHFGVGGIDRLKLLDEPSIEEKARRLLDLVIVSVLLDAGAGPSWRYHERDTDLTLSRSEGLAVASFHMFFDGSLDGTEEKLRSITPALLAEGFEAGPENPLPGLENRAELLRSLGAAMNARADLFGSPPRLGNLFDRLKDASIERRIEARRILELVLSTLQSIWPSRLELGGVNLGDVWHHPKAGGEGPAAGLVPFHKLSQWLAYSLIEPLEMAGIHVGGIDELTGLAEYRNGGLFVDMGVLEPKHDGVLGASHRQDSDLVVEWRALTVVLLDGTALAVREELGMDRQSLPLAKVLEGGTWRAGRRAALDRRPDGSPPIKVRSDGTLF